MSAVFAVLGRIIQQVRKHLGHSDRVSVQQDRRGRQRDGQFVTLLVDKRATRFHGALHHRRQFHPLLAKLQLACRDPAGIEQIIHEPHHLV